jgi:hypothetical protein
VKRIRCFQVVGALSWCEAVEEGSDASPGGFAASLVDFARQGLEFGEDLLDRIEVGRVWRRVAIWR